MADLKTLCIDGECRNIPQGGGGFPLVQVTSVDQLNAIDYPAMVYGNLEIPGSGITGYDWVGIVMPSPGQITQIIDVGGTELIRFNDSPPSGSWVLGKNAKLNSPAFTGTPTAPTAGATTNTTQLATTAFTQAAIKRRLVPLSGTVAQFSLATASYAYKDLYKPSVAGTFFVTYTFLFSTNATGYRLGGIWANNAYHSYHTQPAVSNGQTAINVASIVRVSANTQIQARYWQNSGSTLTCSAHTWRGFFVPDA